WDIIGQADRDRSVLATILKGLSKEELRSFENKFQIATYLLTDDSFVYAMGNVSEDTMLEVCQLIVSQGKEYYVKILANPQEIVAWNTLNPQSNLAWVATKVRWEHFRE